jgi:hypothetical protein
MFSMIHAYLTPVVEAVLAIGCLGALVFVRRFR